jgi:hypothetical protein
MPENQQEQAPQAGPEQQAAAPETPPWGSPEEFNPEKAWNLIQGLRADKERLSARETITDEQKQAIAALEQQREAAKTAEQRQAEELSRWQSEAQNWRGVAVGSSIRALASEDFADPSDAVGQLDPASYLDAGGQIDEARIKADLAELLERKPHWRRRTAEAPSGPRVPAPNRAQGSSATAPPADPAAEFASIFQGQLRRS